MWLQLPLDDDNDNNNNNNFDYYNHWLLVCDSENSGEQEAF